MIFFRYSANRIFYINEYWFMIPPAILANYFIIRKIRLDKKKMKDLKKLREQIEREIKIKKILIVSLGLSGGLNFLTLLTRGGSTDFIDSTNLINSDDIRSLCKIEEGVRYLDDNRLRKIIINLYRNKRKGKIILITATAACHLLNQYGQTFLAFPVAIGDFGLTSLYQSFRKGFVILLLSGVAPLVMIGGRMALMFAVTLGITGLKLGFSNLDFIPTSPVDLTKDLKPRIPGTSEVVIVNNRNRVIMSEPVQENQECWLADQRFLNSNCKIKPTEIPDAIDSVLPDLKYEEIVTMKDTTGLTALDKVEFTDKFDLGQTKPSISKPLKAKEVNFLDKFGDSEPIGESDKWEICENEFKVPEKRYLRTRNKP